MTDISDHMEDTGIGAGEMVKETQRDSTLRTARDLGADEVVTLVEETGTTAEAAVRKGAMVQTPPPPTNSPRRNV